MIFSFEVSNMLVNPVNFLFLIIVFSTRISSFFQGSFVLICPDIPYLSPYYIYVFLLNFLF